MLRSDTKKPAPHDEAEPPAARSSAPGPARATSAPEARPAQRSMTDLFEVRVAMFDVPPPDGDRVASAAQELAAYVQAHEPRTRFFCILQDEDCPGRFAYAAVFDDDEAECSHRGSVPARRFAAVLLTAGVRLEPRRWSAVADV